MSNRKLLNIIIIIIIIIMYYLYSAFSRMCPNALYMISLYILIYISILKIYK